MYRNCWQFFWQIISWQDFINVEKIRLNLSIQFCYLIYNASCTICTRSLIPPKPPRPTKMLQSTKGALIKQILIFYLYKNRLMKYQSKVFTFHLHQNYSKHCRERRADNHNKISVRTMNGLKRWVFVNISVFNFKQALSSIHFPSKSTWSLFVI